MVACMNNMTGDPNQENRPSVFGFEPYPSLNVQPIDWSRIPFETAPAPSVGSHGEFSPSINYQQSPIGLGNFSFCTTQTPHPAQFPFPHSPRPTPSTSLLQNHVFGGSSSSTLRCKRKTDSPT